MTRFVTFACVLFVAGCPAPAGTEWTPAFDASATGWLLSAWGPTPDSVYAVGGKPEHGAVMHFDGSAWSELALGVEVPLLNWAFGFSDSDLFVVGSGGTIIHFDAGAWTIQATPTDQDLWGVWGASGSDLWAVGGSGREDGDATILRYDGENWAEVEVPVLERPGVRAFFKVWGTAADNVWMVGQNGAVLHYDGNQLIEHLVGASVDLIALWGTGPDNIVAVGGRNNGIISVFDGSAWHTEPLAPLPGLNGIWMREPTIAHIVGTEGTLATVDLQTFEVDNQPQDNHLDYHAVFGTSAGSLFAVGRDFSNTSGRYEGVASTRRLTGHE